MPSFCEYEIGFRGSNYWGLLLLAVSEPRAQQALHIQRLSEKTAMKRLKALTYMKRQIWNPLCGIMFSRKMLDDTELGIEQKQLLHISAQCQRQLRKILDDSDLDCIVDGYLDLEMVEFTLHDVSVASFSQVMTKSNIKGIGIVNNVEDRIRAETLYGDSLIPQQIFADFLSISISLTPSGGQVVMAASLTKDQLGKSVQLANLELSITHAGIGVTEALLNQIFGSEGHESEEGVSLLISRKLLKLLNGDVRYLREEGKSSFISSVEVASGPQIRA